MIITTYPRIHITLIGMNKGGYRINGGIGFCLERPALRLTITAAPRLEVVDRRELPLTRDGTLRLIAAVEKTAELHALRKKIKIEISGDVRTHYGFGTGTAIRLATLEALFVLNHKKYTPELLRQLSGRGGTSGIGIYTYFKGGLIFDLGHPPRRGGFRPSSLREDLQEMPLLLSRVNMPPWEVGLCISQNLMPKNEAEERDLFERSCPISDDEAYMTLYQVTFGLYSGVIENDFDTFCKALISIQSCAWKVAERSLYGAELLSIENALYRSGAAAVGMSSLGPCLYFFSKEMQKVKHNMLKEGINAQLLVTRPYNLGRRVDSA